MPPPLRQGGGGLAPPRSKKREVSCKGGFHHIIINVEILSGLDWAIQPPGFRYRLNEIVDSTGSDLSKAGIPRILAIIFNKFRCSNGQRGADAKPREI